MNDRIAIPESSLSLDCNPLYKSISHIPPRIDISIHNQNRNRYIHRGVIGGILLLGLTGCGAQRVMVRDCQDMKDTPWKNCELVQKL